MTADMLSSFEEYSHALKRFTYPVERKLGIPIDRGEFTYPVESQSLLQATFNEPVLDFVCNHNVIWRLTVSAATFTFDDSALEK